MSANNSGVRNLRAMFENKTSDLATSTSPPSRGRSPANSEASLHSRPVSKVRASFVAVERPAEAGQGQQWGLRKASDVGIMAEVSEEQLDRAAPPGTAPDQEAAHSVERPSADKKINGVEATPQKSTEIDGGLGTILKGSPFESSPSDIANAGAAPQTNPPAKPKPAAKSTPTSQPTSLATRMKDSRQEPPTQGNATASKGPTSVLPPGGRIRPSVSTQSPTAPKGPPRKTPTSPSAQKKVSSPQSAAAEVSGETTSKASVQSPTLPKPARKSLPPAGSKTTQSSKPKASDSVPTSNGVKRGTSPTSPTSRTQPRSPTKPVRLPAAATAQTTASVAKASSAPNRSASRTSATGTANARNVATSQQHKSTVKPPNSATASSLAKKSSRASLASQPGAHDVPKPRTSNVGKAPDEGFLARMTRPTASSAQKTHEKLQIHSPAKERRSMAKPKPRKSTGRLEEDKENVADANGSEDHGAPDLARSNDGAVDGAAPPGELSTQPLAAGHQDAEHAQEMY